MLCFIGAEWPLIGGAFTIAGVEVLWPKKATTVLSRPGPLDGKQARALHRRLAGAFPPA